MFIINTVINMRPQLAEPASAKQTNKNKQNNKQTNKLITILWMLYKVQAVVCNEASAEVYHKLKVHI